MVPYKTHKITNHYHIDHPLPRIIHTGCKLQRYLRNRKYKSAYTKPPILHCDSAFRQVSVEFDVGEGGGKNWWESKQNATSVTRSWDLSQFLGFEVTHWDIILNFGKFPKPMKVWEF